MSGFGRKGLRPGESAEGLGSSALAAQGMALSGSSGSSDLARKREAFIAAERAGGTGLRGPGLSEVAERYQGLETKPSRSLAMAYLLWFVAGQVSAHRFYLGAYRSALAQVGLFAFWLLLALGASGSGFDAVGPIVAVALVGWAVWVIGDLFFIHRIHRKLCRRPGEIAALFA